MYIENDDFSVWMQKLYAKLEELFTISGKVYYKASDVREFIKERFSVTTLRQFEKEHCTKKKK